MAAVDSLIDTGVLVGFLDAADQWHAFAVEAFGRIRFPAYTCEAVLSEASYHLRGLQRARLALLEMVDSGAIVVLPVFPDGGAYLRAAAEKYGAKADLADLGLLWLAEAQPAVTVCTTDRKDFRRYRLASGKPLNLDVP